MDPFTHGLLGAATSRAILPKPDWRLTLAGAAGGMIPDMDIFIQSIRDPLLFFEFHRHFSHSLLFIPAGGFLTGVIFWLLFKRKVPLKLLALAATLGYATHPLLDACTSYGTMLFWPFSETRVAWDLISIIDPLFTSALIVGLILTAFLKRRTPVLLALSFCFLYLAFGAYQHRQGIQSQIKLARERGQEIERGRVMPSLGNLIVWRSVYENRGRIYVDAFRIPAEGRSLLWVGGSLPVFHKEGISVPPESILEKDLRRYALFADRFLVLLPGGSISVGDARYSDMPQGVAPIWGIRFDPDTPDRHVARLRFAPHLKRNFPFFWDMVKGSAPGSRTF